MTWQRKPVAAAIAEILDGLDPAVRCFATPPETLNPPAYVCGYARSVDFDQSQFGVDVTSFQLMGLAPPQGVDQLDEMLSAAKDALRADSTLLGVVQHSRVVTQLNWRRMSIGGVDCLAGELTLEIKM